MGLNKDKFKMARRASGMSINEITAAAGLSSTSTYAAREDYPEQYRLGEIIGIYNNMSDLSKPLLRDAVMDIFLP